MEENLFRYFKNETGYCLLCRSKFEEKDLTDEHAIPYGLGGQIVIKKASCRLCQQITGRLENDILRGIFLNFRIKAGTPSRKRKNSKQTVPLFFKVGDIEERVDFASSEVPFFLIMPQYPGPTLLCDISEQKFPNPWILTENENWFRKQVEDRNASYVAFPGVDSKTFARMICKIAHFLAIAIRGPNFAPVLPQFIMFDRGHDYLNVLGSSSNVRERVTGDMRATIEIMDIETEFGCYVALRTSLFVGLGCPSYLVVVGKLGASFFSEPENFPAIDYDEDDYGSKMRFKFGRWRKDVPILKFRSIPMSISNQQG